MKKNMNDLINILMLIPLYYFTESNNMFLFTFGTILYLLISSMFKNLSFKNILKGYYDNKEYHIKNKLFWLSSLLLVIFNILIMGILYGSFYYLNSYFKNDDLIMIIMFMSMNIFVIPEIKLIQEYLSVHNVRKDLLKLFYFIRNILIMIVLILNITIKIDDNVMIIWLFLTNLITFILISIYLYFTFFKYKKRYHLRDKKLSNERVKLIKDVREVFVNNYYDTFITFTSYLYLYIGIICLYLIIKYKYNYTSDVLSYAYLYLTFIPLMICYLFNVYKSKIKNILNFIINKFLIIILLLMVMGNALLFLIYGNNIYGDVFVFELLYVFFYVIYIVILDNVQRKGNKKILFYIVIPGIIIKLFLTLPLIDSFKLMGYNIVLGSITTSTIGIMISSILGLIVLYNRKMINFNNNENAIFNFIYKNIIFIGLLLLFRLLIGTTCDTRLEALVEIILYSTFICGYLYVNNLLGKINN